MISNCSYYIFTFKNRFYEYLSILEHIDTRESAVSRKNFLENKNRPNYPYPNLVENPIRNMNWHTGNIAEAVAESKAKDAVFVVFIEGN